MISAILDTNYSLFIDLQYFQIVFWDNFMGLTVEKATSNYISFIYAVLSLEQRISWLKFIWESRIMLWFYYGQRSYLILKIISELAYQNSKQKKYQELNE